MPSSTRVADRANYENVRWAYTGKKKNPPSMWGKKGPRALKNSPCRAFITSTMRNARFPPTIAISWILTVRRESTFTPRSRSRRPLLLTRGISCRALSITPIDYLPARSPLSNSSRDRDTSFHCLAYAVDKPIASAADVNAFAVTIRLVCICARSVY